MLPGFRFHETMKGTYALEASPATRRRFSFSVEARAPSLLAHLRTGKASISGTVEAEGLVSGAPLEGSMTILPWTRRFIRYEFRFTGDDGKPYRFRGQKDIRYASPLRSFTVLPAELFDGADQLVARCDTRFDLRSDLLPFAASFRPA